VPALYLAPTGDAATTPRQLVSDFVKTNAALTSDMVTWRRCQAKTLVLPRVR
jgi:hypothetical protein